MNSEAMEEQSRNPWRERDRLPKTHPFLASSFFALFLLASAAIPLADRPAFAIALWLMLATGGIALTVRGISGGILAAIISLPLLAVPVWGAPLGLLFLAAVTGIMAGSWLFTTMRSPALPLIGAVLAGAIAFAVTRDYRLALLSLSLLPAVFLLGLATLICERRPVAVIYAAGGLLLSFLVAAVWYLSVRCGTLSRDAILDLLDLWRQRAVDDLLAGRDELLRLLRETATAANAEQVSSLEALFHERFSAELLQEVVAGYFLLLPAGILVLCEVSAFFAQKMLNAAYATHGWRRVLIPETEFFTVGVPTAVLYTVAFFITLFGSATDNLFFAAMENLMLVLMPALCLAGGRFLLRFLLGSQTGMRLLIVLASLAMICLNVLSALYLLAMLGAYDVVRGAVMRYLQKKYGENDDNR